MSVIHFYPKLFFPLARAFFRDIVVNLFCIYIRISYSLFILVMQALFPCPFPCRKPIHVPLGFIEYLFDDFLHRGAEVQSFYGQLECIIPAGKAVINNKSEVTVLSTYLE